MSNENSSSNSSVGIVAILAILILVAGGVWFFYGRSGNSPKTPAQSTTAPEDPANKVKIDLPDSVVIK